MTTLVGWVATQGDGPTSIYLASDSRISWPSPGSKWDSGRKLFACHASPDLFGYEGDALFPAHFLAQVVDLADHHLLFAASPDADARHATLLAMLRASLSTAKNAGTSDFSLVHVARDGAGTGCTYRVWTTSYSVGGGIRDNPVAAIGGDDTGPARRLLELGTGAKHYVDEVIKWAASDQGRTSRAFFTALCDTLAAGKDPRSGGAAQLIGLYRVRNGITFGVVIGGRRYFNGLPVATLAHYGRTEWRDSAFQRIDPNTLGLKAGAQRQVRPRFRSTQ